MVTTKYPRTINEFQTWVSTIPRFRNGLATLEPMRELCALYGNPQNSFKSIHIAGTKGKGTTAKSCACLLAASGHRCGLLTSPEIYDFRERFMLASEFFPDEIYKAALDELFTTLSPAKLKTYIFPEILDLFAFLCFRAAKVEWAAIEVGIGGRLDATNVISPSACILLPVEREHTGILGHQLWEIASEKAGIAKPGVPVFFSPDVDPTQQKTYRRFIPPDCPVFTAPCLCPLPISPCLKNDFEVAFATCQHLGLISKKFLPSTDSLATIASQQTTDFESNIMSVISQISTLPGRFEIVPYQNFTHILDIAHTARSLELLFASIPDFQDRAILIGLQDYRVSSPEPTFLKKLHQLQRRHPQNFHILSLDDPALDAYFAKISHSPAVVTGSVDVVRRFKKYLDSQHS